MIDSSIRCSWAPQNTVVLQKTVKICSRLMQSTIWRLKCERTSLRSLSFSAPYQTCVLKNRLLNMSQGLHRPIELFNLRTQHEAVALRASITIASRQSFFALIDVCSNIFLPACGKCAI